MPNIILLSSEFPPGPGGIGNHAFHLASQLYERGWDVRVISPQDYASPEEIEQFNRSQPFSVTQVPSGRGWLRGGLARFRVLTDQILSSDSPLLLASGSSAVFLAALAASLFRLRMVGVGHGTEFGVTGRIEKVLTRLAYGQADAMVSVSHFTAGLVERLGIRPSMSEVIHNGADDERFHVVSEAAKIEFSRRLGLNGGPVLLTVGNVTERKGQEIVIRALPEVLKKFSRATYLMVGLPTERNKLQKLAEELGVDDHIRFLGRLAADDLAACINCCDVFLMTSQTTREGDCEGFGIAVIEAALCGKPAIVSGNSGLAEAVLDGVTGLVVPEGDVKVVAGSIVMLLSDLGLHRLLSERARSRALAEMTWDHVGLQYDQFLRQFA